MASLSLEAPSPSLPCGPTTLGPRQRFQPGSAPTPSSHLIGPACGDVVGIADRTPSARRAGGTVRHQVLCYLVASSPGHRHVLAAAAQRGVPAAAAAAMVSPLTVVSERAREPVFCSAGAPRPGDCMEAGRAPVGRGRAGGPRSGPVLWREAVAVRASALPRPTVPFPRGPPPVRGGDGHRGHVTPERDFVDLCVSGAGRRDCWRGQEGQKIVLPGSAWRRGRGRGRVGG